MLPLVDAAAGIMQGVVKPILDKFVVDAKDKLEAQQLAAVQLQALNVGQIEINKVEAASPSLFVSGWRPFVGWSCAGSMAYAMVGHDILNWALTVLGAFVSKPIPMLPVPDAGTSIEILLALLGFGGLRTYERLNDVHSVTHK